LYLHSYVLTELSQPATCLDTFLPTSGKFSHQKEKVCENAMPQ